MLSVRRLSVAVLAICAVKCQEGSSLGTTLVWRVVSTQAVSTEPGAHPSLCVMVFPMLLKFAGPVMSL